LFAFPPRSPPTARALTSAFRAKYGVDPGYHAVGGYAAGLILQHTIVQAKSIDPVKVTAALNKMNVTTMFGHTKFATDAKDHGLRVGHDMALAQWQETGGKLAKEVIWPMTPRPPTSP
jgi:branched-chain amino acid transport system substrate-binding protein